MSGPLCGYPVRVKGIETFPERMAQRAPRIVVIGDVMLDRWWLGASDRLTREAPAPVVRITERIDAPGGAANTAMNLAALGARVSLIGRVGADAAGERACRLLEQAGVDTDGLVRAGTTVCKTRIMAGDQVLVRLDDEAEPPPADPGAGCPDLAAVDAVLVCDYGGLSPSDPALRAVEAAREKIPLLVVDAHDPRRWKGLHPDIVTPNAAEAEIILGDPLGDGAARADAAEREAERLRLLTGARIVALTLDRDGALLLAEDGEPVRTTAHPASERFASGAGDTFAAALTAALCSGASPAQAVVLAQCAADIAVEQFGTSVCPTARLAERLSARRPRLLDATGLARRIEAERAAGRRVVFSNGCFDVIHRGHTSYLHEARDLGDVLVVAVNSDASVRRLKGPGHPVNPAEDRAAVLAELECVSYVTVFDDDTPAALLELLRPEVYAKGGDYSPEMLTETAVVEAYGGEVAIVGYVADHSTSGMIARIRSSTGAAEDAS